MARKSGETKGNARKTVRKLSLSEAQRADRLAAALRDNLKRRKTQLSARATGEDAEALSRRQPSNDPTLAGLSAADGPFSATPDSDC